MESKSFGGQGVVDIATPEIDAPVTTTVASRLLQRIADTLGVTVELFRGETPALAERSPATTAEVHALLDSFLALREPDARRRCISLASAERANGH